MNDYGIQMPDGVQVDESTDTLGRFVIQNVAQVFYDKLLHSSERFRFGQAAPSAE